MYQVQIGCFQEKNKKAIDRMKWSVADKLGMKCTVTQSELPELSRVLIDKEYETLNEAKKTAQIVFSVCGFPSVVRRV